ncbi:MAG: acyltransferase family protein [Deltaproteobacteria bacterium]|nr:acyltransferase family protein [Deltaproteobacteria bacterium]
MLRSVAKSLLVPSKLEQSISRMPVRTGPEGWDPWGLNPEAAKIGLAVFKLLYDHYFRVIARGLENIPASGRVMVVANHSGQLPFDGALVSVAMATNPYGPRIPRPMVERFFPTVPFVSKWLMETGSVIGDPVNCIRMLQREDAVVVFPEGVRGAGKKFSDRYRLMRFGHGFLHIAIETNTPIVPVGIVGCEETMPAFWHVNWLARLLKVPYVPVTIPFPLPARVRLLFGEPLRFSSEDVTEEGVAPLVEQVKGAIRRLIQQGLAERKGIFRG